MGKKEIEQKKNYELPLSIFLMGFSLNLIVLIIILFNTVVENKVGKVGSFIIAMIILYFSTRKAHSLAKRLDENVTFAVALCIILNAVGLFIYWIYYLIKTKEYYDIFV